MSLCASAPSPSRDKYLDRSTTSPNPISRNRVSNEMDEVAATFDQVEVEGYEAEASGVS